MEEKMSVRRATKLARICQLAATLLVPIALAGCLNDGLFADRDRDRPRDRDPLTGLPSRSPVDQRSVSANPPPDRLATATLASSSGRGSEGVSGLGIRDGFTSTPTNSGSNGGSWSGGESRTAAPGDGAKLGSPKLGGPTDSYSTPAASANGFPTIRMHSFEEAQQFLMARGVKWQRLQMQSSANGPGEWTFSCTIPNRSNPNIMKTYEGRDRYGLIAIQKVIDEIAREQGSR
jgi:hypothetical protein